MRIDRFDLGKPMEVGAARGRVRPRALRGLVPISKNTASVDDLPAILDKAISALEQLLKLPSYLSLGWLRVDPTFAPLRGNSRFERLANGAPVTFWGGR